MTIVTSEEIARYGYRTLADGFRGAENSLTKPIELAHLEAAVETAEESALEKVPGAYTLSWSLRTIDRT